MKTLNTGREQSMQL